MSLKALDELRGMIDKSRHEYEQGNVSYVVGFNDIADAIEAEIAERFMELPVDADGVPIHVGDTLECHANGYDGVFDAFAIGDDCVIGNHPECELFNNPFKGIHVARYCHHAKPRTIEDVLYECFHDCMYKYSFGIEPIISKYADEIRELMGGGE